MKNKKRARVTKANEEIHDDLEDINMNELLESEDEYSEDERKLLHKVRSRNASESYDSDQEVYALEEEEESDKDDKEDEDQTDSMESDVEGLQDDLDLPNEKAWGKQKKMYYSTDYVDPDYATFNEKDLAKAEMEEEEARNIQKRLIEQLDDADFGLDLIESNVDDNKKRSEEVKEVVKTDLSQLSKRQKQVLLQKESPEFMALIDDYKDRILEARDLLAPFLKLVKKGILANGPVSSFVEIKYHLLLNYTINVSFYLMLKAKRLPVTSHPVIKRLAQYRQLINQLESKQGDLLEQVQQILKLQESSGEIKLQVDVPKADSSVKKGKHIMKCTTKHIVKSNEDYGNDNVEEMDRFEDKEDEENKEEGDASRKTEPRVESNDKRAITYQIAKNKGLMPSRKKEQRNPRVKHRNKYRKAKIRRKGAVREVRKELTRYSGEISGIKASVKKSIKLK